MQKVPPTANPASGGRKGSAPFTGVGDTSLSGAMAALRSDLSDGSKVRMNARPAGPSGVGDETKVAMSALSPMGGK